MDVSIEYIKSELEKRLSPKRYNHCLNVAANAKLIAGKTDRDPEKMYLAGLLHDAATEASFSTARWEKTAPALSPC